MKNSIFLRAYFVAAATLLRWLLVASVIAAVTSASAAAAEEDSIDELQPKKLEKKFYADLQSYPDAKH